MLWLIWEMWIVLALFFAGGVIAGWVVRGRSDVSDAPAAKQLGFATRMDAPEPARAQARAGPPNPCRRRNRRRAAWAPSPIPAARRPQCPPDLAMT